MKWQYNILTQKKGFGALGGDVLNKLGMDGWELVSVTEMPNSWMYIFKRQVQPARNPDLPSAS